MSDTLVTAVANYHCITGENPLWNEREGRIYWEDIESGRLFRADHATLEHECFYQGGVVGGFTFQEDGTLLLFEVDRIASLDPASGQRVVLTEGIDGDMRRFNDVIADPGGRVFAGTIGRTDETGGLYRVDVDGSIRLLWKGTGCANGMGFTRDLRSFYWTCSTTRILYVCDYDAEHGEVRNRRPFYEAPESEGTPDGLSVDAENTLWSARWGGSAVLRISPEARVTGRVTLPVPRVSSVAFGGPQLDTLYITTAGGKPGSETADGTLYRVPAPTRGQPEFRSRIRL
jgi:D-xylono/L-arabinono-1,4-lactonase